MNINKEIIQESKRFVQANKGYKINRDSPLALSYSSPRLSSEFPDCSMPLSFDSYSHCSLGCAYCFALMQKMNNPTFANKLHAVNPKKMINEIEGKSKSKKYKHFYKKRFLLHWGGFADPFCNFEKANNIGYEIISGLAKNSYPTLFSFKGSAIFRPNFRKLFGKYAKQKNFAFQCSIIAPSDKQSREIEIGVQVTSQRIKALKMLSDMGYYCILRLRPFIVGITDDGLDDLLYKCLEAGVQAVSMEYLALDWRATKTLAKRYKWIGELIGVKNIMEYFKALSPIERGSYLRLNRLVKEETVKKVYRFCIDNDLVFGCSDPDFKELCTSGSCCAMPDKYPENKELQNWTKNQLTFHIKEARKKYHLTGSKKQIRFQDVFKPEEDTYLTSKTFTQDFVAVTGKTTSERQHSRLYDFVRDIWNNLRSPGNPRNYFNGKLMPIRTDENDNLVYIYRPSSYEDRWLKEGIDLTK